MTRYVGLLRAVNVGGTGKMPMADLRAMCAEVGFTEVATYIASGNVVFSSALAASAVKDVLEARLAVYAGAPVPVMIREAGEMVAILDANPYPAAPGNKAVVVLLDEAVPVGALADAIHVKGEEMVLGQREIYVHYVNGQGTSKLRIPAANAGTARNMNTVKKLVEMVEA